MVDNKKNRGKQDYDPSTIESRWQKAWNKNGIYSPNLDTAKKPFYNLMMFPYPSAEGMHVGNMYAFTGADVYGRFKRMQGFDVFEPIGLDGFGIHSENYAIKVGQHPKEQAKISEKNFYRQLRATGNGFDWSRKLETYDPKYYKWTQWLFIQLFKAGLAYRSKAKVNWCPSCKTVLADEQVIQKIKNQKSKIKTTSQKSKVEETVAVCERCETEVIKKELEQWFFRITKYADRLLNNIEKLDWSEKVKIAQRQWIGRSEGARIRFKIYDLRFKNEDIEVFTTRPDTLYGATFLVLAPEHRIVASLLSAKLKAQSANSLTGSHLAKLKKYIEQANKRTEQERMTGGNEKTGVFTNFYAINPVNNEKIPVWIADYVLMDYGTGAIMAVPAHDQRDFEFARKYNLPIKTVILGSEATPESLLNLHDRGDSGQARMTKGRDRKEAYTGEGIIVNSGEWNGWRVPDEIGKVIDWLEQKGVGKREVTYHLRDWLISRQRYWGPPIPMIFCQSCAKKGNSRFTLTKKFPDKEDYLVNLKADSLSGWPDTLENNISKQNKNVNNDWDSAGWFSVPEDQLPVLLPNVKDWKPKGSGKSPLANVESFVNTTCPNCNGSAKRETDVSDNFLDSSWYFFRYTSTDIESKAFDVERVKKWLPVKMYIGGAEHSVLHLLYSRFITMVLKDLGFIEFHEPFSRFYAHGLLVKEGAKMSKSKGNVVVPDEYIRKYGADTLRCYLMFLGPFNQGGDFYDTGIEGMSRFIKRVWRLIADSCHPELVSGSNTAKAKMPKQVRHDINKRVMHKTIKKVTDDIKHLRYNTAIAAMMEWYNYLNSELRTQNLELTQEEIETYLKLLSPFAPHMAEELWQQLKVSKAKKVSKVSNGEINPFGTFDTSKPFDTFRSVHLQPWPTYDPKFLEEDEVTIVVQVNGKVRETIKVESGKLKVESYVEELVKKSEKVGKYLGGKSIKKVVYVEGKVINFVTE